MTRILEGAGRKAVRAAGVTMLALLAACAGSGAGAMAAPAAAGGASLAAPLLYVCVQGEARVDVIDMTSLEVVASVDLTELGFSPNANPHHVAVAPNGAHWFVSLIGENRVARFTRANELAGTFEMSTPGMLALDPAHQRLLASRSMTAVNPPSRIGVMSLASMDGDELDVFHPRPHPIVVTRNGDWAYTGSLGVNQIAAVELATEEVSLVQVEGPPHSFVQFALSPDERWMVAATELSGRLLVFDRSDPAQPRQVASVEIGPMAFDPVFAPDGRSVWVPVKGANEIAVVDVEGWRVGTRVRAPSLLQPHQVVFSPDGMRVFVSNNNRADAMAGMAGHEGHEPAGEDGERIGNVTVLDAATHRVVEVLELGRYVTGMGTALGS